MCKWTYSAEKGWDDSFWKMIGLEDFVSDNYSKIGTKQNKKSGEWLCLCIYEDIDGFLYELYKSNE